MEEAEQLKETLHQTISPKNESNKRPRQRKRKKFNSDRANPQRLASSKWHRRKTHKKPQIETWRSQSEDKSWTDDPQSMLVQKRKRWQVTTSLTSIDDWITRQIHKSHTIDASQTQKLHENTHEVNQNKEEEEWKPSPVVSRSDNHRRGRDLVHENLAARLKRRSRSQKVFFQYSSERS